MVHIVIIMKWHAILKHCLVEELNELDTFDKDGLLERRYERLMSYGYC